MAGIMTGFNDWLKKWSGIIILIAAVIIALSNILGFTKALKDIVLSDVYDSLYKIEHNDLKHIDLSLEYLKKGNVLNLDIQVGAITKEEALTKMLEIERWYSQELENLRKIPMDRKKVK
jgi:hypothetical protein